MAARSLGDAALRLVWELRSQIRDKEVHLFLGPVQLDAGAAQDLQLRLDQLDILGQAALEVDNAAPTASDKPLETADLKPVARASALPTVVAGGLEAASAIAAYFRSDDAVGGAAASSDDGLLEAAVAGVLASGVVVWSGMERKLDGKPSKVFLGPATDVDAGRRLQNALVPAMALAGRAAERQPHIAAQLADASASTPPFEALWAALAGWQRVRTAFEDLMSWLCAEEGGGASRAQAVSRALAIMAARGEHKRLLFVRLGGAVGSYYVRRNLWSSIFGVPFYVMGGAVISYTLLDGRDGQVLAAGIVPQHGGFYRVDRLARALDAPSVVGPLARKLMGREHG